MPSRKSTEKQRSRRKTTRKITKKTSRSKTSRSRSKTGRSRSKTSRSKTSRRKTSRRKTSRRKTTRKKTNTKQIFDWSLTTKYYSTNDIKSKFNPKGGWISMPIICDESDKYAAVLLNDEGKYANAYGFPTLQKAKEKAKEKGTYLFYKLHNNRENCSKSSTGDLIKK